MSFPASFRVHRLGRPLRTANVALALCGLASTAAAQPASVARPGGILGQRLVEVGGHYLNRPGKEEDARAGAVRVSFPVHANVDVAVGYRHQRTQVDVPGSMVRFGGGRGPYVLNVREHAVTSAVTGHLARGPVAPFVAVGLDYAHIRETSVGARPDFQRTNEGARWSVAAGLEWKLGTFALTPRIQWQDTFSGDQAAGWRYGAEAHLWFTRRIGGFVGAERVNREDTIRRLNAYFGGVRVRF